MYRRCASPTARAKPSGAAGTRIRPTAPAGVDVACLPIGDHYTMSPREAAYALRLLGVQAVVPMHFGTFPVLAGTPDALKQLTKDIAGLEIIAMKPGDTLG